MSQPEMSPAERTRIIEKIKKCLALGKSANEHEAAAALRQAQALMKKYKIDELEVEGEVVVNGYVDSTEKYSKTKPLSLEMIVSLMMRAFGVKATFSCSHSGRHRMTYWGSRPSVTVALHAHRLVYRAVNQAWEKYRDSHDAPLARDAKGSFVYGWCVAVASKVENLAPQGRKEELLKKAMDSQMGYEIEPVKSSRKTEDADLTHARAGAVAGKDFNIFIPVGEAK